MFALTLAITAVVMGPVAAASLQAPAEVGGIAGLREGPGSQISTVLAPLQEFLARHAEPGELDFFHDLQGLPAEHPLALIPAFLVTELGEALQISLLILVPFVLVDLVLAQVLVLMGLGGGPTQPLVGLPLKIALFLAVGGWDVIVRGLVERATRERRGDRAGAAPRGRAGAAGGARGGRGRLAGWVARPAPRAARRRRWCCWPGRRR